MAVGHASRFNHDPGPTHWKALIRILRYLKGTLNKWVVITVRRMPIAAIPEHEAKCGKIRRAIGDYPTIIGYSDSDLAGCPDTARSTGGYVFYFNGSLVSWRSKRQSKVATSTAVAEFYALNDAAKEGIYLKRLAAEFDPQGRVPKLVLLGDNETANNMGELARWKDKSKHVRIAESYIHEIIKRKEADLYHVPSGSNIADIMTKPLPRITFERLRDILLGHSSAAEEKNKSDWKVAKLRSKRKARANKSTAVWGSCNKVLLPGNQNHGTHLARRHSNFFACLGAAEVSVDNKC